MAIEDGGPAFPASEWHYESQQYLVAGGMSMRDYFAAKAMQGWVSASPSVDGEPLDGSEGHAERIATISYVMADAMLKARSQ